MANTRQSKKRAGQAVKRQARNQTNRSQAKTVVNALMSALKTLDVAKVQVAYKNAVCGLSKAGSKGAMPKARAARKTSRITLLVKKTLPAALAQK